MQEFKNDIEECLRVLKEGGLILYPTDTVWGLGCDATNAESVQKIFDVKKRNTSKSLVVLLPGEREVIKHVAAVDPLLFNYLESCTRPTTVIYEHALGFAENVIADDGSVAIRICRESFCAHLLKRFKKPIVSTSANISETATPANFHEVSDAIKNGVDYVVKYRQNDESTFQPSTIIQWKNNNIVVVRP